MAMLGAGAGEPGRPMASPVTSKLELNRCLSRPIQPVSEKPDFAAVSDRTALVKQAMLIQLARGVVRLSSRPAVE